MSPTALAAELPPETPLEALTLRFDVRYDNIDRGQLQNRVQSSALVAFTVRTLLDVDLVGMASTGDDFSSRWATSWDLTGGEPERMALSLRQLYLERWFGPVRAQAGSLAPVKGDVSTSGLEDLGWIDGVRVEAHTDLGLIVEGVGGSLTDIDEPDLFIRARRLDYAELEGTWALPANVEVEAAFHHLAPDSYLKSEVGWAHDERFGARAEGSVNVGNGATMAVLGLGSDLLLALSGRERLTDRLVLESRVRWVDPDFGRFGELSEDFYQFGADWTVRLDGAIDPDRVLMWHLRYIAPLQAGLAPRLDVGLRAKLRLRRAAEPG